MPRKSKEKTELDEKISINKTEKKATPKTKNKEEAIVKKETTKKAPSKKSESKKSSVKEASTKKIAKKGPAKNTKESVKKESTKEGKISSKPTLKSAEKKATSKSKKVKNPIEIIEYYDLPYRYDKTIIKLLAQTPTSLFVYWDISDEDKNNFIIQYGENFFKETKPVLLIHNETMNYTFEVEINDFANSWYLKVNDANCTYKIELGRKYYNKPSNKNSDYIYITSSNELKAPNNHILFNNLSSVYFKNVKTNEKTKIEISNIKTLKNIGKIYNIYDLYKKIYSEENIDIIGLYNPSSGISFSSFKI